MHKDIQKYIDQFKAEQEKQKEQTELEKLGFVDDDNELEEFYELSALVQHQAI